MDLSYALLVGFVLAAGLGVIHHFALTGILKIAPHHGDHPKSGVLITFTSLVALHSFEILVLSGINSWLIGGPFEAAFDTTQPMFADILYLTGIAFTTLGYASVDVTGNFRVILMFQSLLGFMILTWSATFLFSACQKSWQKAEE